MPDISKINALAIGSVAKVDGLAKASILDIDGVAVPSAVGAPATAFSVRLLGSAVGISSYTGDCMRVRRASDNVEADVGFDTSLTDPAISLASPISNTSDAQSYTDFADFVDHTGTPTNAFCRYWYDQSGNSTDAGQSTAPSQPKIYDATTGLITENGKPALDFNSSKFLTTTSDVVIGETTHSCVGTFASAVRVWYGKDGNNYIAAFTSSVVYRAGTTQANAADTPSGQTLYIFTRDATTNNLWSKNGSNLTMTGTSTSSQNMNNIGGFSGFYHNNNLQELITWSTNYVSTRSSIESDINTYFSIY